MPSGRSSRTSSYRPNRSPKLGRSGERPGETRNVGQDRRRNSRRGRLGRSVDVCRLLGLGLEAAPAGAAALRPSVRRRVRVLDRCLELIEPSSVATGTRTYLEHGAAASNPIAGSQDRKLERPRLPMELEASRALLACSESESALRLMKPFRLALRGRIQRLFIVSGRPNEPSCLGPRCGLRSQCRSPCPEDPFRWGSCRWWLGGVLPGW